MTLSPAHAERVERAIGALDAAARRLPACPAGPILAVIECLDRARSELAVLLGRALPAPPGDEDDDGTLLDDSDANEEE